jgi:branched-subunit amino acid aminotransferase/4-amino-4-deoxychorismate lyase
MNNAKNKGCDEVIMHKNNIITEGGASNVFFANDKCVFTPRLSENILPGITRELLIMQMKETGITVEEGEYTIDDLINAKSIWLTSSTKGLAQVSEVIDQKINIQLDHPLFKKCEKIFINNYLS